MSSFEEDLQKLSEGLRVLRALYSRYFVGSIDRPPYELQRNLQALIRRQENAGASSNRRTAERFRFNSMVSDFNVLAEMWKRNVRSMEEGRPSALQAKEQEASRQERGGEPPENHRGEREVFRANLNVRDSNPENESMKKLYDCYLAASRTSDQAPKSLSYTNFYRQVHARVQKFRERSGAENIQFRVVIVDNRPTLKLRSAT